MRTLLVLIALAACSEAKPTSTGTPCDVDDPTLGYDRLADPHCTLASSDGSGACFGKAFMDKYCIMCHDSALPVSKRNGAPLLHDFNYLEGVMEVTNHIDQQAGIGPMASNHFMPGERCPSVAGGPLDMNCLQPTDDERETLAKWVACAETRPYRFLSDGGIAPDAAPDGSGSDGSGSSGSGSD